MNHKNRFLLSSARDKRAHVLGLRFLLRFINVLTILSTIISPFATIVQVAAAAPMPVSADHAAPRYFLPVRLRNAAPSLPALNSPTLVLPPSAAATLVTDTYLLADFEGGDLSVWQTTISPVGGALTPSLESVGGGDHLRVDYTFPDAAWGRLTWTFDAVQDWRTYEALRLSFYGNQSGNTFYVSLLQSADLLSDTLSYDALPSYAFLDDFSGWQQLDIPWADCEALSATLPLTQVAGLAFWVVTPQAPRYTLYLPLILKATSEVRVQERYADMTIAVGSFFRLDDLYVLDVTSPLPAVSVGFASAAVVENAGLAVELAFTRTGALDTGLLVSYTLGGTATPGVDTTTLPPTVTFPLGMAVVTRSVAPLDDDDIEGDETLLVTLTAGAYYTLGTPLSATLTLLDDDDAPPLPAVSVGFARAEVAENAGLAVELAFTRTGALDAELPVSYTLGGTATPGADYATLPTTVTFPLGMAVVTRSVAPLDDDDIEGDETLVVTLTAGAYYTLGTPLSATLTLLDDDAPPPLPAVSVGFASAAVVENAGLAVELAFTRTGALDAELPVSYTLGGTATPGADTTPIPPTVTFPLGAAVVTRSVAPLDDDDIEGDETLVVTLVVTLTAGAHYTLGTPLSATLTLLDDDDAVMLTALDAEACESPYGVDGGALLVTRVGSALTPLTLHYRITGTARNGIDYVSVPTTTLLPAGALTATLFITPQNDFKVETEESVVVELLASAAYSLGASSVATVTLRDDDRSLRLAAVDALASEAGLDEATFVISRMVNLAGPLDVTYTLGGEAQNGVDYETISETVLHFAPGQSAISVTLTPRDDLLGEGSESVTLTLAIDPAYMVNGPRSVAVVIADDEHFVAVAAVSTVLEESAAALGRVHFTRVGFDTAEPLTVSFALDGTATVGADYILSGTIAGDSVVIPAGATSVTLTVQPLEDGDTEGNETLSLSLLARPAYLLGESRAVTLTLMDSAQVVEIVASDAEARELSPYVGRSDKAEFAVMRSGSLVDPLTVTYRISGTAVNGLDYAPIAAKVITEVVYEATINVTTTEVISRIVLTSDPTLALTGTAIIPAGELSTTIPIYPKDDMDVEPDESISLTLVQAPQYTLAISHSSVITITDGDVDIDIALVANPVAETIRVPYSRYYTPTDSTTFTVTFYATPTTSYNAPLVYVWNFGDGSFPAVYDNVTGVWRF